MGNFVNSGFNKLSSVNFIAQTERIITAMTGNANFPEPWPATVPSLAQIQADLAALQPLVTATAAGDRTQVIPRRTARTKVQDDLLQLGMYVQGTAQGDLNQLVTTGFPLRQAPQTVRNPAPPPAPAQIEVARGPYSGSLVVTASRVPKAASYEVQLATADPTVETNWSGAGSYKNSRRIQLQGLMPGKQYAVRIRAIGTAGNGPWATAASLVVV